MLTIEPSFWASVTILQESKFLGGDMEHTHLVKGLDFALLQKVRSEIATRENEEEDEEEEVEAKETKKLAFDQIYLWKLDPGRWLAFILNSIFNWSWQLG